MTSKTLTSTTFPTLRPRRLRRHSALRRMVRETTLSPADFIYPLFVRPGKDIKAPIKSMPGQCQISPDQLPDEIDAIMSLGFPQ